MKDKTRDCRQCRNMIPNPTAEHGFQEFRCAAYGFYVKDTVLNCGAFKRRALGGSND